MDSILTSSKNSKKSPNYVKFFRQTFGDLSLVYHRWDFEFLRNLRRVMKIQCLQFKFNFAQKKVFSRSITKLEDTENINDSKSQVSNML